MKRLIVCCDGTWCSEHRGVVTHVQRLRSMVEPVSADGVEQVVYYDEGIGTEGGPLRRLMDGMTGRGLTRNILDAYAWLIRHYEEEDQIFVYGFSRGAYTVRSLAGMIRKCGILRMEYENMLNDAYVFYRDRTRDTYSPAAQMFREQYSVTANVFFVGVWDTVGTLGIPLTILNRHYARRYAFHDQSLSRRIRYGYQALALDEHRRHFMPTLWRSAPGPGQTIEQVWFAGSHGDVGGSEKDRRLSDFTLRWMLERSQAAGLALNGAEVERVQGDCLGAIHDSRRFFFRLYPAYQRPVCALGAGTESVHESVMRRMEAVPDYRPPVQSTENAGTSL
ncbi:MAG: DUF2235 domain-containing protein [Kiritimatiellae bacterium]|nr:DUF2235 domain-containing protein [Kiritimatiellia bacterium]